tara:strand:- start:74 stop:1654 length:1581 start_codon:yes stop_codon:yes gene_type:complete
MQVKGVFYNKPVVTDNLELYLDAANINSLNPDDVTFNGASVNAQTAYTSSGSFVVPVGITSISAVCVGGGGGGGGNGSTNADAGGGGGGGLSYGTFTVTPGETLTIVVGSAGACASAFSSGTSGGNSQVKRGSTVLLQGGGGAGGVKATQGVYGDGGDGGTSTGTERDGGGTGGDGGNGGGTAGSGGGAAGYSGNGGDGNGGANGAGDDGAGGGGGGGGGNYYGVGPQQGGGVGILGEGTSGTGGPANNGYNQVDGNPGSGGSGVTYGGGGGGAYRQYNNSQLVGGTGGVGAVRLVYQPTIGNRQYPTLANIADTTYSGPTNTWKDLSVNGNDATLNFSDFSSDNGGCISFDGTNDYGYISTLDLPSRPFTLSVWINHQTSLGTWQSYMGQDTSDSGVNGLMYFQKRASDQSPNNAFSVAVRPNNSTSTVRLNATEIASLNVWYNLCVVISSSDIKFYINGELNDTTSNSNTLATRSGNFIIGAAYYNNSLVDWFRGKMSTAMVYSKALTASEVLQNYNALKKRYI